MRPNHHVTRRQSGIYWYRWTIPARLRPVMPPVTGFPDLPNRVDFTISLRTADVRLANIRAAAYEPRVAAAIQQAERVLAAATIKLADHRPPEITATLPASITAPTHLMLDPALVHHAIAAWRDDQLVELHRRAYNQDASPEAARLFEEANEGLMQQLTRLAEGKPAVNRQEARAPLPAFPPDGNRADWIRAMDGAQRNTLLTENPDVQHFLFAPERQYAAALEVAEERSRGLLTDWTPRVDAKLAGILAMFGMRIDPDHPVVRKERTRFAKAWLAVLKADIAMLRGEPDIAVLMPPAKAPPTKVPGAGPERVDEPWSLLPFMAGFDDWVGHMRKEPRQVKQYQRHVREFAATVPAATLGSLKRKDFDSWVAAQEQVGTSEKTILNKVSSLRDYWKFLHRDERYGVPEIGPFYGEIRFSATPAERRRAEVDSMWLAFAPDDVPRLWRRALMRGDQVLADLIRLDAFCGARIESLCQLNRDLVRIDPVSKIRFMQFFDKTKAGIREVPVHPAIDRLVDRLLAKSRDGYLIVSTSANENKERSQALGKDFGRMKTDVGFGKRHVFQSIRKTVASLLARNARLHPWQVGDIVGHERQGTTARHYISGLTLDEKLAALVAGLTYGDVEFMTAE